MAQEIKMYKDSMGALHRSELDADLFDLSYRLEGLLSVKCNDNGAGKICSLVFLLAESGHYGDKILELVFEARSKYDPDAPDIP